MSKVSTLALIAFLALMATSCDLINLDLFKTDQDSSNRDSSNRDSSNQGFSKPDSGPSALGVAERQAAFETLLAEFDEYWLTDREIARREQRSGTIVPAECEERYAAAIARDEVLANALFIAVIQDKGLKEIYDLWGKRIDLLQEIDRDMKQSCR